MIRTLKHGDDIPKGTPRKYLNAAGYVRLRWRVGPGEYVEAYEHRVVMGLPHESVHVHHKNHIRDDNRPENLELLDVADHLDHHGQVLRTFDRSLAVEMYRGGDTLPVIAARLGCGSGTLSRALRAEGVETRAQRDYFESGIDTDGVATALLSGATAASVARFLGASEATVRRIGRERGWRGRPGRPVAGESEKIIREVLGGNQHEA